MNQYNRFSSVTYTFLYSIPNGIESTKIKLREKTTNKKELINKENIRLHNTLPFEKTKIPRVKSMTFI